MDGIDLLVLAIIQWCDVDTFPARYTKVSKEDCAEEIANCGIDDKGKVASDARLRICSEQGRLLLRRVEPKNLLVKRSEK
mgnify:FL=1